MARKTILLLAILFTNVAAAAPKVPIEQCVKWRKLIEGHETARREGFNSHWHRTQKKKIHGKMFDANCPARHNAYFK